MYLTQVKERQPWTAPEDEVRDDELVQFFMARGGGELLRLGRPALDAITPEADPTVPRKRDPRGLLSHATLKEGHLAVFDSTPYLTDPATQQPVDDPAAGGGRRGGAAAAPGINTQNRSGSERVRRPTFAPPQVGRGGGPTVPITVKPQHKYTSAGKKCVPPRARTSTRQRAQPRVECAWHFRIASRRPLE